MLRITYGLERAALLNRNAPAASHGGRGRTWSELCRRVACLAGGLSRLGVGPNDRVAILALNSDRYLEAMYAVPWAGAIVVPLNTRLAHPELVHQLSDAGAGLLLVDGNYLAEGRRLATDLPGLVLALLDDGPHTSEIPAWDDLAATPARADAGRAGDDEAGIFYTGGTTGRSKGVVLSHSNLVHNVLNLLPHFRFGPATRCLHASPMFHIADSLSIYGVTIGGGQHFFLPKFEAGAVLASIAENRITVLALVPTMVKMLLDAPDWGAKDLGSLRNIFYGGSHMPEPVMRRAVAALPGVDLHQGYGLTETSPTITYLPPERHAFEGPMAGKATSAGQAVCTVEVAIRDETGVDLPAGAVGEICVKGPTVMRGYWRNPEATRAAFHGDWFRTGDIGRVDEDGFLFVVDRAKDMIVSGGENVYSAEVENILLGHPAVLECAVIGLPDPQWGERVHAVIRLRPGRGAAESDLVEHCRQFLARYKCPRSIEFKTEALPMSGAGKVLKSVLRKHAMEA